MSYEAPTGPLYEVYEVAFRHDAITGPEPVTFSLRHALGNESVADADAVFQKLIDLINSSPDFYVLADPTKTYEYRQKVTPTP